MGRGLSVWLLCLTALLLFCFGAQVNPLIFMLAGVLVPLPVLLAGWRPGGRGALLLALVTALGIFILKPGLEVILANLGLGSLPVLGETGGGSSPLLPGVSQADLEAILQRLLPGLVVANTGLVAWLNVILARQIAFFLGWGKAAPPLL